jgi:AcrR family transcriptional regulator
MDTKNNWSERQREILSVGIKILSDEGAKSLTLKRIGEIIGISEAAIYRHFSGKKELLLSLHGYVKSQVTQRLASFLISGEHSEKHLELLLVEIISYFKENKGISLIFLSESIYHNDPDMKVALKELISGIKSIIKNLIESGMEKGHFRKDINPDVAAIMIMGIVQISMIHLVIGGMDFEPSLLVKNFMPLILKGISD